MSNLIDSLIAWCDKNGTASYGQLVERACIAMVCLSILAGFGCGVFLGLTVVR